MQPEHTQISRRQLLRGDVRGVRAPRRPPWSLSETAFVERCTRCADCAGACPEQILRRGAGGYPEIDFSRGGCTFCGACATACPAGAIEARDSTSPWDLRAQVLEGCLSARGVVCRACSDACTPRAIQFRLATGGRALARIQSERCNGCGACLSVCPVGAIRLRPDDGAENIL